jgi:hypothetical protein
MPDNLKRTASVTDSKPICRTCLRPFLPNRSDARYCSSPCRQRAYRRRIRRGRLKLGAMRYVYHFQLIDGEGAGLYITDAEDLHQARKSLLHRYGYRLAGVDRA